MPELLPATRDLLVDILDGLAHTDADLPELRVMQGGRGGVRYWLHGSKNRSFTGRRPFAQFDELKAARLLRKLRADATGTYYAFTPAAFEFRDQLMRPPPRPAAARDRPNEPPPELTSARSRLELLREQQGRAKAALVELAGLSAIKEFRNDPGSDLVFIPMNPWTWDPLPASSVPALGLARAHTDAWLSAARGAIAIAAPEHLDEFDTEADVLRQVYVRAKDADAPARDSGGVITRVEEVLATQMAIIERLPGAVEPSALMVVPDTNALLQDPDLELWVLGEETAWIVLAQQVTAELDGKKVDGNEKVKAKADSLIRRFKEYGRRGDTFEGVRLAHNKMLRELPLTPDMTLFPALDPTHADDRIAAAALRLAAEHLSSRVVLVTRDRNLQNKARFLGLPAIDVADV